MHGSHSQSHDHAGHSHGAAHANNERRMGWAAALTGAFMFAEVAGGVAAGSLALIADAGHMLTDFASLALAWFGFRLSRRPADWRRTFGFDRFQVLVAFANGLALFAIAGWIVYEAIERLMTTPEVSGSIMVVVAALGLLVNIAAFWLLRGADRDNLNIRGAAIHVLGDLLGSVAALAAGAVILLPVGLRSIPCSPSSSPSSSSRAVGRWWPIPGISCSKGRPASSTPGRSART